MGNKKILPPRYFIASIILMIILHFTVPLREFVVFPYNLIGLPFLLAGGLLNFLADREFKRVSTTVKPFEVSSSLVTGGVFNYSRNPMYLGMVIFLIGESIFLGSLMPFLIVPPFVYILQFYFIKREEKMLNETFPVEYAAYMAKVRRWI